MRRTKQVLTDEECAAILERGEWGVLALAGDEGYPYALPLNYVFLDGRLYFHSAKAGHKIDAIERSEKASFCVVDESELVPSKFGTAYRSVIVFGRVRKVSDPAEQTAVLRALVEALAGGESEEGKAAEIDSCCMRERVEILALEPEHITGKCASDAVIAAHKASLS